MSGEFKGTAGPWGVNEIGQHWNNKSLTHLEITFGEDGECICDTVYQRADANLISAAPELLEALQWALPMAIIAMEQHRMERVKSGHRDISGTYKNGESWVGIYQDEIDKIEFARAAIAKALGESQ